MMKARTKTKKNKPVQLPLVFDNRTEADKYQLRLYHVIDDKGGETFHICSSIFEATQLHSAHLCSNLIEVNPEFVGRVPRGKFLCREIEDPTTVHEGMICKELMCKTLIPVLKRSYI